MKDYNINYHLVWQHSKDTTTTDRALWLAVVSQAKDDCSAPRSWQNWYRVDHSYSICPNIRWLTNIMMWLDTDDFRIVCENAEIDVGQTSKMFWQNIDETIAKMPDWIKNLVRTKNDFLPKSAVDYIIERIG